MERLLSNTLAKTTAKPQNYTSLAAIRSAAAPSQLIDVLISNVWPGSITQFSSAPLPSLELASSGVGPLDDTVRRIKPRYHFAAGAAKFWEREPFVWDEEDDKRVTRFVSLGAFGGVPTAGKKQRVSFVAITNIYPRLTSSSFPLFAKKVVLCLLDCSDCPYDRSPPQTREFNTQSFHRSASAACETTTRCNNGHGIGGKLHIRKRPPTRKTNSNRI